MMKLNNIICLFAAIFISLATGCIKNDIPYARIQANLLEIEAEGQTAGAKVDTMNRTVNFYFPEEVDIAKVHIASWKVAEGVTVVGDSLDMELDMTSPVTVTLRLYQDYVWTLIANQTINRYFSVESQIGTTTIDVPARRVVAYVSENIDRENLLVETCKLAPEGWSMTPEIAGQRVDFTKPVEVTVDYYGSPQIWEIYVEPTESKVTTVRVDAGTNVAWVYGDGEVGTDVGFEYRPAGVMQWTKVPDEWITIDGGSFSATIRHLEAMSEYEVRAFSGSDYGATLTFTTGSNIQIPNSNFDSWWLSGKVWNPWPEGGLQVWDTGNKGTTTIKPSNSTPTEDTSTGTGYAAKLETIFAGFGGSLGKIAAGNIFVGKYVRTDGTNGILSFGYKFDQRPTGVRGYIKYTTANISHASTEFQSIIGQPDTCIVWVALIDTPEPFEIRTNPTNRKLFDPEGDYVIAYGKFQSGQSIPDYIPIEFKLDYKSTQRVPRYILWTCSASKYGDYFTGGVGAVLYADDFELLYDY